jgi:hypothetical protein
LCSALRVLRSFFNGLRFKYRDLEIGIDVDPEEGVADSGNLESDLAEVFVAVGEAAAERSAAVALIVDEMQYLNEEELSALIMAMHQIAQRQLPVVLVGAGLPQLVGLTGRSKSYAERLFQFPEVGALQPAHAAEAIQGPAVAQGIEFTDQALREIIGTSHLARPSASRMCERQPADRSSGSTLISFAYDSIG